MLKDIIPAAARRYVYAAYALAATVVGALSIAEVGTGKAVEVIAYLGVAVGAVAAANTTAPSDGGEVDEAGGFEPGSAALGLVVGLLIAYLLLR